MDTPQSSFDRVCIPITLLCILLLLQAAALAQDPAEEEQYQNGLLPAGTYSPLAGLGAVNMHNGGFTISIPILSLPGRAGHSVAVALSYNS
ncbi:MAG TPA: hypothetical protein VLV83_15355, partial [Acidobacteriota bacterium]|nr:hypothetical protein [Acidobacteriota bacterium]